MEPRRLLTTDYECEPCGSTTRSCPRGSETETECETPGREVSQTKVGETRGNGGVGARECERSAVRPPQDHSGGTPRKEPTGPQPRVGPW